MSPLLLRVMLLTLAGLVVARSLDFSGLVALRVRQALVDFDSFHVVGRLAWQGRLAEAYSFDGMERAFRELTGLTGFLPWTYPPPFDLVAALLATLPIGLAYLLFVAATGLAFLVVLRRVAGPHLALVLVAIFPALSVTIACGQNGFLTGALAGLACLGLARGRASAGWPLGLMVVKPHLAVGLALHALAARRWATAALAAGTVAASCGLATLAFGPGIWAAFLGAIPEAGGFLREGRYPLFRMISVYAAFRSFGLPASPALAIHGAVALAALAATLGAVLLRLPSRSALGIAVLASLLVSPYAYDYDLPLYGVALALLAPDLLGRLSRGEMVALCGLGWAATLWGQVRSAAMEWQYASGWAPEAVAPVSISGLILPVILALVCRALLRRPGTMSVPPMALAGAGAPAR